MFAPNKKRTIIAEGQKVVGSLTSDGTVEIRGIVEGEVNCSTLMLARTAHIIGSIRADSVSVSGTVEGPIECQDIAFTAHASVVGDVECASVAIMRGAFMQGRLRRRPTDKDQPDRLSFNRALTTPAERELQAARIAETETVTRMAELVVEARHLSGNPDLPLEEALIFLANRGNPQAKVLIEAEMPDEPKQTSSRY